MTSTLQELGLFLQHPAVMERANPWQGRSVLRWSPAATSSVADEHCTLWVSERELGKGT